MSQIGSCFKELSKLVAETCNVLGNNWRINTEKYDILKEYCDAFDRMFDEFEAESFTVEVMPDRCIAITFNCIDINLDGINHPFFGLIERSISVNIKHVTSEEIAVKFVFPSVWDRIG